MPWADPDTLPLVVDDFDDVFAAAQRSGIGDPIRPESWQGAKLLLARLIKAAGSAPPRTMEPGGDGRPGPREPERKDGVFKVLEAKPAQQHGAVAAGILTPLGQQQVLPPRARGRRDAEAPLSSGRQQLGGQSLLLGQRPRLVVERRLVRTEGVPLERSPRRTTPTIEEGIAE